MGGYKDLCLLVLWSMYEQPCTFATLHFAGILSSEWSTVTILCSDWSTASARCQVACVWGCSYMLHNPICSCFAKTYWHLYLTPSLYLSMSSVHQVVIMKPRHAVECFDQTAPALRWQNKNKKIFRSYKKYIDPDCMACLVWYNVCNSNESY